VYKIWNDLESHVVILGSCGRFLWIEWRKMQVHLFPRSDVPRCRDTQNEAFRHVLKDLGTISVCEDWSGEEAWYLAQQIEEAIVCISMCIIVTDIYAVTWRISCNWSWSIGRRQICLLLSGINMEKASCVLSVSRILRFWVDGLVFSPLDLVCRLDLGNLSWRLCKPVQPRQRLVLTMVGQSLFKFLDSEC